MPYVEVRGKYRTFRYDGDSPLDFTTYNNLLCVVRRPNPTTFITLQQYVPGQGGQFTTFQPGSSYTIVTRADGTTETYNFDIGPYTRVDRLPSTINIKSPGFYVGLDKNSIVVPISSYALSVNSPLSSVVGINYINGQGNRLQYVYADNFKTGAPLNFTHMYPNSGYELRSRIPFTFFAPLQSEMGDAFAFGANNGAYGMGYYLESNLYLSAHNIYGVWDKISVGGQNLIGESDIYSNHVLALSACGNIKKLFATGANNFGQLGTGDNKSRSVWTAISGEWLDIAAGYSASYALSTNGRLFSTGLNTSGQLGITSDTSVVSATTFTQEALNGTWSNIAPMVGGNTLLAISANGKLFACGMNSKGQCGTGDLTPSIYILTKEIRDGYYTNAYGVGENSYALSGGRLLGSGSNQYGQLGIGTRSYTSTFTPEVSGFTNVVDVFALPSTNCVFIRTSDGNVYGTGRDFSGTSYSLALGVNMNSFTSTVVRFQKSEVISQIANKTKIIAANKYPGEGATRTVFYTIIYNNGLRIYNTQSSSPLATVPNVFNIFGPGTDSNCTFLLSARNDNLRPTPTPTITPSPTPSPVPFAPYNTTEIGIFGGSFQINTHPTSMQSRVYNTPGNLANLFTYEKTNNYTIPPGATWITTFDYEKTSAFNNIIGVSQIENSSQNPSGRYESKYLWKRIGTAWSYSLLPASLDGARYYRQPESGADSLIITPPHPDYPGTSQGIYTLAFANIPSSSSSSSNTINIAESFDRGATWNVREILYGLGSSNYSLFGDTMKMKFSRTRNSNYEIGLVGYSGQYTLNTYSGATISQNTLLYFKDSNGGYRNVETVDAASIIGFDFKHDYYNVPTVASIGASQIRLSRKINGTWQTNVVLDAIPDVCLGPYYQVPESLGSYKRGASPVITMEFDPTNPDLVYIAYLRRTSYFANAYYDPAKINVCCYNMKTNTLVFDESVVFAKYESGPYLLRSSTQYIDIPTLYFDTSNNTLNLFFYGPEFAGLGSLTHRYYKTRRLGTNNWAALTNIFTDTNTGNGTYMTNSWELKTKY